MAAMGNEPNLGDGGGEATPTSSAIDVTLDGSNAPEATPEHSETTPSQVNWEFSHGVTPDTVVAIDKNTGEPITAGEIHKGYLRQADYTTKRTAEKSQVQEQLAAIKDLQPYIPRVMEGSAEDLVDVLLEIAEARGLDMSSLVTDGQPRDSRGRFASAQSEPMIDPSSFEEGSVEHTMALAYVRQGQQLEALQSSFEQFVGGMQNQFSQVQLQQEIVNMGDQWKASGMEHVELEKAMELVGQQITPRQAMLLANLQGLVKHNASFAQQDGATPNDPRNLDIRGRASLHGRPLSEATLYD